MAGAVNELLRQQDYSAREIDLAVASYRQQFAIPDSQVARFFDFLEDEALVRIRLHVSYRLMDAIADCCRPPRHKRRQRHARTDYLRPSRTGAVPGTRER